MIDIGSLQRRPLKIGEYAVEFVDGRIYIPRNESTLKFTSPQFLNNIVH